MPLASRAPGPLAEGAGRVVETVGLLLRPFHEEGVSHNHRGQPSRASISTCALSGDQPPALFILCKE